MAIAFDSPGSSGNAVATSVTVAHTCTGSNLLLWVSFFTTGNDSQNGVTYNGTTMTQAVKKVTASSQTCYLYYLAGPSTGTNNIVANDVGSQNLTAVGMSFTGCAQTGIPDAVGPGAAGTGTTASDTLTTVADNSFAVACFRFNTGTKTAGAGTTNVGGFANPGEGAYLTSAKTPAGSVTMSEDSTASAIWGAVIASFAPSTAAAFTPVRRRMMAGIGT